MLLAGEGPPSPPLWNRLKVGSVPGSVAGVTRAESWGPGRSRKEPGSLTQGSLGVWCFCLSQLLGISFSFLQDPRRGLCSSPWEPSHGWDLDSWGPGGPLPPPSDSLSDTFPWTLLRSFIPLSGTASCHLWLSSSCLIFCLFLFWISQMGQTVFPGILGLSLLSCPVLSCPPFPTPGAEFLIPVQIVTPCYGFS